MMSFGSEDELVSALAAFTTGVPDWGFINGLYADAVRLEEFCANEPLSEGTSVFASRSRVVGFATVQFERPIGSRVVMISREPKSQSRKLFVVGGTIKEFLSLGCVHGFHDLDLLTSEATEEEFFSIYAKSVSDDPDSFGARILEFFSKEFQLEPWGDVRTRLRHLNWECFGGFGAANWEIQ